jgi:alkaline phosphatase
MRSLAGGPVGLESAFAARRPKNIIFAVVDGMAIQTLGLADTYRQMIDGQSSYWAWLIDQPWVTNGWQTTPSLSSVVTDSAAASTTWGAGRRVWNGMINMYPDKTELVPIVRSVRDIGMRTGLVTTTTITHATPAGFAVACVNRDLEGLIAEKYLDAEVDILLGGGNRSFDPARRASGDDLYAKYRAKGYGVVRNRADLLASRSEKLLGVFSDGHLPYTVDRDNDATLQQTVPTLAEMTRVALDKLKGARRGFLLQVEGGRVDHGGHTSDLGALLFDQIAFEEALKVIVDFARQDGETLVIITADHACGGPSLNGSGDEYADANAGVKQMKGIRASYGALNRGLGAAPTAAQVRDAVVDRMSITLTADEAQAIADAAAKRSPFQVSEFYGPLEATLGTVLGNHTKVTWTSLNHTAEPVIVTALGPGHQAVRGLRHNVDFHRILLSAKGLKDPNPPQMDYANAKAAFDKLKVAEEMAELSQLYGVHEECPCHIG